MPEEITENVKVTDPFWLKYMELIRTEMLPYQWSVLNDEADIVIEKERDADYIPAEKSHALENFRIAAGRTKGHHYGMVFQDSDVYKWLEAAAYSLQRVPDAKLQELTDGVVDLIAAAQEADGYLGTYFTTEAPERKFKRLYQSHELYCAGHFIEAAVAYYQAVGSQTALQTACRLADRIAQSFGPEPQKIHGYDGHEEIELALFRLYEVTKEERYLELGRFFLYERGKDPAFFKKQCAADPDKSVLIEGMDGFKTSYYQNHKPILMQETAEGHAVRVVYMCTGMAKLAYLHHDQKMLDACQRLWKNIVEKRMYITGAIGSTVIGEAFTADYDLPNDTMYGETCASVGLIFFAHNLLRSAVRGEYVDVMERALYNTVLSGMAQDGKHFFYVNPLEVVPELSHKDPGKSHIKTTRPAWFGCACCPPNLARLLNSLQAYTYMVKDDTIYTELYMNSQATFQISGQRVVLVQETTYPWEGKVAIQVEAQGDTVFGIALRVPAWARAYTLCINGEACAEALQDGYVVVERNWKQGDRVELAFSMQAEIWQANPKVRSDIHRAAVLRGPFVYCMEGVDNGAELELLRLDVQAELRYAFCPEQFGGVGILHGKAWRERIGADEQLYYTQRDAVYDEQDITLIPYYCWGNRGENEMLVWMYKK